MAKRRFTRPGSKDELNEREASGFWNAIKLARKIGESDSRITLQSILDVHHALLAEASPEVAGRFRLSGEDVKKLKCIEPPPGRLVKERVHAFWLELDQRLAAIPRRPKHRTKTQERAWFDSVISVAAWAQHRLVAIHPFGEGNGRVARLLTNIILRAFQLPPSRVKFEGEAKEQYLTALCQADHAGDYEPLKKLIARSVFENLREEARLRARMVPGR